MFHSVTHTHTHTHSQKGCILDQIVVSFFFAYITPVFFSFFQETHRLFNKKEPEGLKSVS